MICDDKRARQVAESALDWGQKTVLLTLRNPDVIAESFRKRGAHVGLVTVLDELIPCQFLVEGDSAATSIARELLVSVKGEVSIAERGSRAHIEALRILAGPVLMAVLEGADLNLRHTGLPLNDIRKLLGRMALETLRVHQRSKARTWRAPDVDELERTLARLTLSDPKLADHLKASEGVARALIGPIKAPGRKG